MGTAQRVITGPGAQCHLEFDRRSGADIADLVIAVAELQEPAGVQLVVGFRPALWAGVVPELAPADAGGVDQPVRAVTGAVLTATQRDVWVRVAGATEDLVVEAAQSITSTLAPVAVPLPPLTVGRPDDGCAPAAALQPDGTGSALVQQSRDDPPAGACYVVPPLEALRGVRAAVFGS